MWSKRTGVQTATFEWLRRVETREVPVGRYAQVEGGGGRFRLDHKPTRSHNHTAREKLLGRRGFVVDRKYRWGVEHNATDVLCGEGDEGIRAGGRDHISNTAANTQYVVARMKEQNTQQRAPGMAVNILYFSIPDDPSKKWSAVQKKVSAACCMSRVCRQPGDRALAKSFYSPCCFLASVVLAIAISAPP